MAKNKNKKIKVKKQKKKKEEEKLEAKAKKNSPFLAESQIKAKISDKSELEEEVEEQEIPSQERFKQFLQTKKSAPALEKVMTREGPEITSLEKEAEAAQVREKKEEIKYEEAIKYDIESEYQEALKKQREITPEMISQVAPVSSVSLERIGRERTAPVHEFKMRAPAGMPAAPSSEEYNLIKTKKSKEFQGETTTFQEGLERRYETK